MQALFLTLPILLASTVPQPEAAPAEAVLPEIVLPGVAVEDEATSEAAAEEAEDVAMAETEESAPDAGAGGTGFPIGEAEWALTEMAGAPFTGEASLAFPEPGRIAGKAPCNRYTGSIDGTPEGFSTGNIAITQMACPDMAPEQTFLASLESMSSAEIAADRIVLRNADGDQMVFEAPASDGAE